MSKQKQNNTAEREPAPQETKKPAITVDLLGRDPFVDRVYRVADSFREQRKTACYAINGAWGTGKTYVLDLLDRKLSEADNGQGGPKFIVLRYNCWEYDYYDEPLLSLVATILDAIDKLRLSKVKETLRQSLIKVRDKIVEAALAFLDEKTGGAASLLAEAAQEVSDEVKAKLEKSKAFDDRLSFRKAVKVLREQIAVLSGEAAVVFLVDELDRCLPEYAIRVLERLHHLFEGIDNVQVIFSVDRVQLEHVVRQLYGEKADAAAYLKKFISFELKLDQGNLLVPDGDDGDAAPEGGFDARFASYVALFEPCSSEERREIAAFKARILDGFDMRKRIALVEKAELIHRMIWTKKEKPMQYWLCMELMLVAVHSVPGMSGISLIMNTTDNQPEIIHDEEATDAPTFKYLNAFLRSSSAPDDRRIWEEEYGTHTFRTDCLAGFLAGAIFGLWTYWPEKTKLPDAGLQLFFVRGDHEYSSGDELSHIPFAIEYWDLVTKME